MGCFGLCCYSVMSGLVIYIIFCLAVIGNGKAVLIGMENFMCKNGSNGIRDRGPGNVYGLILDGIGLDY